MVPSFLYALHPLKYSTMTKTFNLIGILILVPALSIGQQDTSKMNGNRDLRFKIEADTGKMSRIVVPDEPDGPRLYGSLLIVEIPRVNPDHMPIWKPDSSVNYFLKIVKPYPAEPSIPRMDERVPMIPLPRRLPDKVGR
jgi:hypothetical protein